MGPVEQCVLLAIHWVLHLEWEGSAHHGGPEAHGPRKEPSVAVQPEARGNRVRWHWWHHGQELAFGLGGGVQRWGRIDRSVQGPVGFDEEVPEMTMKTNQAFQIVLGVVGLLLLLLAIPSVHDNAASGVLGIVGGALITLGAAFAFLRNRRGTRADQPTSTERSPSRSVPRRGR